MKKEELENLRPTIKQALEKAAHFCAYRERCQNEVHKKLADLKLDQEDIDEVIYLLIRGDFLNEERYAKIYCKSKFNQNKWGRNKIKQHLKQKNISERNIRTGLFEIKEEQYIEILKDLIIKKKSQIKDKNQWIRKKKVANYLLQKGYEYELITEFL